MSLVNKIALVASASGIVTATLCGLLWLLPRWTDHLVEHLPERQAHAAVVRDAWTASRIEGELMRLEAELGPSDTRLRAGRTFDEALDAAAHAVPDPDRQRTISRLTASMRHVSRLERSHLAIAMLAAERDRQLERWSDLADSDVLLELAGTLRPLGRLADLAAGGGLLALVVTLWASAAIMRRVEAEHADTGPPPPRPRGLPARIRPALREAQPLPLLDRPHTLAVVDIAQVLAEVIDLLEPLAAHHGHTLVTDVGPDLDSFVVDPEQLHAVIEELVEGPLRTSHPGVATLRARREGFGAAITLVHHQHATGRVFDPPARRTVLAHDGVEAMGGQLWWSAEPGDGVRAALWVPDRRFVDGRVVGSAS